MKKTVYEWRRLSYRLLIVSCLLFAAACWLGYQLDSMICLYILLPAVFFSCLLQLLFIMNFGAVQNVMRSCQMKVHFLESLIVVRIAVINCGMIMIKWIQTCCSWQKQKTATEVTVF